MTVFYLDALDSREYEIRLRPMFDGPMIVSVELEQVCNVFTYNTKHLHLINTDFVPALVCALDLVPMGQESELQLQAIKQELLQAFDDCDELTPYGQAHEQVDLFISSLKFIRDSLREIAAGYGINSSEHCFPYSLYNYDNGTAVLVMKSVPAHKHAFPTTARIIDSSASRRASLQASGCEPSVHYWL